MSSGGQNEPSKTTIKHLPVPTDWDRPPGLTKKAYWCHMLNGKRKIIIIIISFSLSSIVQERSDDKFIDFTC